jgi:phage terminase small subunit
MAVKGHGWMEGEIAFISTFETMNVSGTTFGIRNLKKDLRKTFKVGDTVTVYFNDKSPFYATNVIVRGSKAEKEILLEIPEIPETTESKTSEIKMKPKKTAEEYISLIKDMEPFVPQEVLSKLKEGEKSELLDIFKGSVATAVNLYDITATYDDTKKDIEEIAATVLELAFCMTVIIDTNTKQMLKKNLPKEPV